MESAAWSRAYFPKQLVCRGSGGPDKGPVYVSGFRRGVVTLKNIEKNTGVLKHASRKHRKTHRFSHRGPVRRPKSKKNLWLFCVFHDLIYPIPSLASWASPAQPAEPRSPQPCPTEPVQPVPAQLLLGITLQKPCRILHRRQGGFFASFRVFFPSAFVLKF